ncbi:hypothetical protein C2845_PM10G12720 [Panicum miliaceum]|uniref:KIB1-4 beta-propeller domain-containing protein n=1 Tax=Panicum miliaceum TaxID=4540 RepID=A0A3L6PBK2_PANMI|nr:hypothetical protein C2845_PM10G12720 [Panicum miliaceum]
MVREFVSLLDCNLDRMNVAAQCTSWRDALGHDMRARQLPWMLVPYRRTCLLHPDVMRRADFFCFLSHSPHKVTMPHNAYGARFIGAYDGCWMFFAFGQRCGVGASSFSCVSEIEAEDVTYFRGFFYVLSKIEDLIVCKAEYQPGSGPDILSIKKQYLHFLPLEHENGLYIKARYIVESRGEILMVVRYTTILSEQTTSFALFRMIPDIETGPYLAWEKIHNLDGRMIFVGRGSSRCFETNEFLESHQGVYFHDDDAFNMPTMVAYGYNGRKYPCHDNGCWPGHGKQMKRWYEWKLPSSYTSPVWLLH